jgi:hypothetical protein
MKYLLIRYRAKALYDGLLPICGGALLTWALMAWHIPVFPKDGYLEQVRGLVTILGGFFIAALTLITTDRNPLLLESVGGLFPPRLPDEANPLNRRRFLAYLFGYLAFSSFMLAGASFMASLFAAAIRNDLVPTAQFISKMLFLAVFNTWLSHVFVATLLGLFYFTERLQIIDPKVRVSRARSDATDPNC